MIPKSAANVTMTSVGRYHSAIHGSREIHFGTFSLAVKSRRTLLGEGQLAFLAIVAGVAGFDETRT